MGELPTARDSEAHRCQTHYYSRSKASVARGTPTTPPPPHTGHTIRFPPTTSTSGSDWRT